MSLPLFPGNPAIDASVTESLRVLSFASTLNRNVVGNPPELVLDPISSFRTVANGSTIQLEAFSADGTVKQYQWFKDGVSISGATSSIYAYVGNNLKPSYVFKCLIYNNFGSVWTAPITVTVV